MKMFRKVFKFTAVLLLLFVLLLFIGQYIPVSGSGNIQNNSCRDSVEFAVIDKGIHAAIVVPVDDGGKDWETFIDLDGISPYGGPPYEYLEFGWGEQDFYMHTPTWSDLRPAILITAIFWPSSSVMHIAGHRSRPAFYNMRTVKVCNEQYQKMAAFIKDTFETEEGKPIYIDAGYGRHDGFYKAKGRYHLFRNCNHWVADALSKAGLTTPLVPMFPSYILEHLD